MPHHRHCARADGATHNQEVVVQETDIIALACQIEPEPEARTPTLKEALSVIGGHGFHDQLAGSITEPPFVHAIRVDRFVLTTDEQGFTTAIAFDTAESAVEVLDSLDKQMVSE